MTLFRGIALCSLPMGANAAGAVFDWLPVKASPKDIAYLDKQWDSQGKCNGYYQSPIDVPKTWIEHTDNSQLNLIATTAESVYNAYTFVTDTNTKQEQKLIPVAYDASTMATEQVIHSQVRNQAYLMKYNLNDKIAEADSSGKKNFFTLSGANTAAGSDLIYDNVQVHWHFPSEHAIDGVYSVGELHFVHSRRACVGCDAFQYLVTGFMMEVSDANPAGTDIVHQFVEYVNGTRDFVNFDFEQHFGTQMKGDYFRWKGGLTTPGCDEVVEWILFEQKYKISQASIDFLMGPLVKSTSAANWMDTPRQIMSARPLQPLNGRTILKNKLKSAPRPIDSGHKSYNYKVNEMWEGNFATGSVCHNGVNQSPVDLVTNDLSKSKSPIFGSEINKNMFFDGIWRKAADAKIKLKNTGHGFKWEPKVASEFDEYYFYALGSNEKFSLDHYHIHFPAEHTIDGMEYAAEIHFVHLNKERVAAGGTAKAIVLCFFLALDDSKASFMTDLGWGDSKTLPSAMGDYFSLNENFNIKNKFLTAKMRSSTILRYEGGLTTPGCTEIVTFMAFQAPVGTVKQVDIDKFHRKYGANARRDPQNNMGLMPLNSRCVTRNYVSMQHSDHMILNTYNMSLCEPYEDYVYSNSAGAMVGAPVHAIARPFDYYSFVQPQKMDAKINKQWDNYMADCKGYYQSPIDIPMYYIQENQATHKGTDKVDNYYTYITHADKIAEQRLVPPLYDPHYPPQGSAWSEVRQRRYQMKVDLDNSVHEQLNQGKRNYLTMPGTNSRFDLLQMHWHFHSEHAVGGVYYVGELHFVHKNTMKRQLTEAEKRKLQKKKRADRKAAGLPEIAEEQKRFDELGRELGVSGGTWDDDELGHLVLGVMMEEDSTVTGDILSQYVEFLKGTRSYLTLDLKTDYQSIFQSDFYRYRGGLTTPSCLEDVEWFVFTGKTLKVSKAAIEYLMGPNQMASKAKNYLDTPLLAMSARPVQPIHGRKVVQNMMTAEDRPTDVLQTWNYKLDSMWKDVTLCIEGKRQSPVNLDTSSDKVTKILKLPHSVDKDSFVQSVVWPGAKGVKVQVRNTGHGFNWEEKENGGFLPYSFLATGSGMKYKLSQFHVHFPAEHYVDGYQYPAEFHFVHMAEDGSGAIVLCFFLEMWQEGMPSSQPMRRKLEGGEELTGDEIQERAEFEQSQGEDRDLAAATAATDISYSKPTSFLSDLGFYQSGFRGLPPGIGDTSNLGDIDIKEKFLKKMMDSNEDVTLLRYEGSLTTPPCSEIVTFMAFKKPVGYLLERDIQQFYKLYGPNARPLQPLNNRCILSNYVSMPLTAAQSCNLGDAITQTADEDGDDVLLAVIITALVTLVLCVFVYVVLLRSQSQPRQDTPIEEEAQDVKNFDSVAIAEGGVHDKNMAIEDEHKSPAPRDVEDEHDNTDVVANEASNHTTVADIEAGNGDDSEDALVTARNVVIEDEHNSAFTARTSKQKSNDTEQASFASVSP